MVELDLDYEHDIPDIPSTYQYCLVLAEPNRTTSLNGRMPWLEFQKLFLRFLIKQDHDKKADSDIKHSLSCVSLPLPPEVNQFSF